MALTGLTWSFTWYRTAVYSLFGGTAPKVKNTPRPEYRQKERKDAAKQSRPDRQRHTGREKDRKETTFNYAVWDKAADAVHQLYPTYKSVKLGMEGIEIAPNPNTDRRQTDKIQFDPQTGRLVSITYYKDPPASQTLKVGFMPSTPAPGAVCGPRYFISWLLSSEGFSRSAAITCGTNESSRLDRNVNVFVLRNTHVPGKSKTEIPGDVSYIL